MMSRLFHLIEIRAKITSLFVFAYTLAYLFVRQTPIYWDRTAMFFISLFAMEMMLTALNKYSAARSKRGTLPMTDGAALGVIALLALIVLVFGLWLVKLSGMIVLAVGALCCAAGLLCSYRLHPITHTRMGVAVSAVLYGIVIPFLLLQINYPTGTMVSAQYANGALSVVLYARPLFELLLIGALPALLAAAVLPAIAMCSKSDAKQDRLRHSAAIAPRSVLFIGAYAVAALLVALGVVPWPLLCIVLTYGWVSRQIKRIAASASKREAIGVSVRLYVTLMSTATALLFVSGMAERWL